MNFVVSSQVTGAMEVSNSNLGILLQEGLEVVVGLVLCEHQTTFLHQPHHRRMRSDR